MDARLLLLMQIAGLSGGWLAVGMTLEIAWTAMERRLEDWGCLTYRYGTRGSIMDFLEDIWSSHHFGLYLLGMMLTPILVWPGLLLVVISEWRDRRRKRAVQAAV